jgi:heterodisulfide reductase subunit C
MSSGKIGQYFTFSDENASFKAKIEELSGESIDLCFQCGACSSGCPLTQEMDLLPSTGITCFDCEVRCPRGIDIANVMEALRQTVLRGKYDKTNLDDLSPEELRELPQIAIISSQRKLTS